MPETVIADTSCFIVLNKIGELDLLQKLYGTIITTIDVAKEFKEPLPHYIKISSATDKYRQSILELQIDKGEASAIALAMEIPGCKIIIDDFKARKIAQRLGLQITGTIGVIIKAKLEGYIASVKPLLLKIRETDFRLSLEVENIALKEAGE